MLHTILPALAYVGCFLAGAVTCLFIWFASENKQVLDDLLPPECPAFIAKELSDHPEAHVLAEMFGEIERFDIRVVGIVFPDKLWAVISHEITVGGTSHPLSVGTLWGAEVFLNYGDTNVVVVYPSATDLNRIHAAQMANLGADPYLSL